jgi:hypothetical protein
MNEGMYVAAAPKKKKALGIYRLGLGISQRLYNPAFDGYGHRQIERLRDTHDNARHFQP